MSFTGSGVTLGTRAQSARLVTGGLAAAAVSLPHALGLALIAYAPLAAGLPVTGLLLAAAALPCLLATLLAPRPGVAYAPTTVVALCFAGAATLLSNRGAPLDLQPAEVLAVCAATSALAFALQWALGALRLASLTRFLPMSVIQGFAAGVGLSMLVVQVRAGFGAGSWQVEPATLGLHAAVALAVVGLVLLGQRWRPGWPWVLPCIALLTLLLWAVEWTAQFAPVLPQQILALPPLPAFGGVPWLAVLREHGMALAALALATAVVNSLDVVVFNQELALEHGQRADPNRLLQRESLIGIAVSLLGWMPASLSSSRSRILLRQAGPHARAGLAHAIALALLVGSAPLWLPYVPMACLSGAMLLAGLALVPPPLWQGLWQHRRSAGSLRSRLQAWLVAGVFAAAGGGASLMVGLAVATMALLRTSAQNVLRRAYLDGELRSRRLRSAASEQTLSAHMGEVAVFTLQGVMSFGVAGALAELVHMRLRPQHHRVILDAHRVPAWDATALAQLAALARDLAQGGRVFALCGLAAGNEARLAGSGMLAFGDLDHALEWAENAALAQALPQVENTLLLARVQGPLGELAEGVASSARLALQARLHAVTVMSGEALFRGGDAGDALYVVQDGTMTLCTTWPPATGLRLSTIGPGVAFGEMAFLADRRRSACAGATDGACDLVMLTRADFDAWAAQYPADAVRVMANLAMIGTRWLGASTRQLRAVLE